MHFVTSHVQSCNSWLVSLFGVQAPGPHRPFKDHQIPWRHSQSARCKSSNGWKWWNSLHWPNSSHWQRWWFYPTEPKSPFDSGNILANCKALFGFVEGDSWNLHWLVDEDWWLSGMSVWNLATWDTTRSFSPGSLWNECLRWVFFCFDSWWTTQDVAFTWENLAVRQQGYLSSKWKTLTFQVYKMVWKNIKKSRYKMILDNWRSLWLPCCRGSKEWSLDACSDRFDRRVPGRSLEERGPTVGRALWEGMGVIQLL